MSSKTCQEPLDLTAGCELEQLEAHLQARLQVRELRLSLRDGGIVLRGRARTYYAKQLAQHAVMNGIPLPIRANEIEVQ